MFDDILNKKEKTKAQIEQKLLLVQPEIFFGRSLSVFLSFCSIGSPSI